MTKTLIPALALVAAVIAPASEASANTDAVIAVPLVQGWNTVGLSIKNPNGSGVWTGREILDAIVGNESDGECSKVWFGTDYNDEGWYYQGQNDNSRSVPEGGGAYIWCTDTAIFSLVGEEFDETAFLEEVSETDYERWTMVSFASDSDRNGYDMCDLDTVDPVGAVAWSNSEDDIYHVHPCAWSTTVTERHISINYGANYIIDTSFSAEFGENYVLWFDEAEVCEDGIDNDSDGEVDEGCYQDK